MVFLNKEESLKLAEQLGIKDADKLGWNELQSAIASAQKDVDVEAVQAPEPIDNVVDKTQEDVKVFNEPVEIPVEAVGDPTESVSGVPLNKPIHKPLMADYYNKQIMISPELRPERYRLLKYDEDLGEDIEVVERQFEMDMNTDQVYDISGDKINYGNNIDATHDYATGTYRLVGRNGKRVVALSSVPKENYGSGMTIGKDYVPIVSWNGRNGYLWTHQSYPNVKALLQESGYYHEYKELFTREPNIWYVAGKTLACDIGLVHQIFNEIEMKERKKREEERAYRERLGL